MANIEAGVLKGVGHRVCLAPPLPLAHKARQPAQRIRIETQRLSRFTGCGFAAICDDVCGHGRTKFAISLVHKLDRLFSLLFRRKVQVDVWPLIAAL